MRHFHGSHVMSLAKKIVNPTGNTYSGTVFFFHGSGDTGPNVMEWVHDLLGGPLEFPHIKVVYPTAPSQPYTPNGGESTVWFDRKSISIDAQEDRQSVGEIHDAVRNLLKEEMDRRIPASRIIVGGFSMGGALAMHTAYHINKNLAGAFACSAFLNNDSIVYRTLKNYSGDLPELKMFHGTKDNVVPVDWGRTTFNKLSNLDVEADFTELPGAEHELVKSGLEDIQAWINRKLPPK